MLSELLKNQKADFDIDEIDFKDKDAINYCHEPNNRSVPAGIRWHETISERAKALFFEDIIAMNALYHSPMQWIQFIDRKHGRKQAYAHPKAKAALENTYELSSTKNKSCRCPKTWLLYRRAS